MKMMPQMMPPTLSPVAVRYRLLANTRRLRTFYASISPRDTGQTVGEIYYAKAAVPLRLGRSWRYSVLSAEFCCCW